LTDTSKGVGAADLTIGGLVNRSAKPASCQILAFILAISLEPGVTLSFTSQMLKSAQEMKPQVEMGKFAESLDHMY
jgi:hypothetical protein